MHSLEQQYRKGHESSPKDNPTRNYSPLRDRYQKLEKENSPDRKKYIRDERSPLKTKYANDLKKDSKKSPKESRRDRSPLRTKYGGYPQESKKASPKSEKKAEPKKSSPVMPRVERYYQQPVPVPVTPVYLPP